MKRKILSIFLTLVLVLSFSLVAAVPVAAAANKTVAPPNIDGSITSGEWEIAQIEFDTGPRPYGDDNLGSWDLSGAKGRFLWDETNLYGLVEAYPNTGGAGANPNGPFDAINFEVYVNGVGDPASYFLTAWPDGGTEASPGAVVMGSPDAMLIEFKIPIANIICREPKERSFNPTTDWLEYRLSTTDPDAAGGFCSVKQTGGEWLRLDFTNTTVVTTVKTEQITAINVEPGSIDFGTVKPGEAVSGLDITVENIGTVTIDVKASLQSPGTVFKYLKLDNVSPISDWRIEDLAGGDTADRVTTLLEVPRDYSAKGEETNTLIFTARTY